MGIDICDNCGASEGLHHYETNQCPKGGVEAPVNRNQEWQLSAFDNTRSVILFHTEKKDKEIFSLQASLKEAEERIETLQARLF